MNNLFLKLKSFMQGRNGFDKLTGGLLVVYCLISAVRVFVRAIPVVYIIINVVQYAFLGFIIYRMLSKNIQKRYRENIAFEKMISGWMPYIERMKLRLQFAKTHRFRTCRNCGEVLRFKKMRGTKEIKCPHCRCDNKFFVIF